LFSITKTLGSFSTLAIVSASWKSARDVDPSPQNARHTRSWLAVLAGEGHAGGDREVRRDVAGQVVDAQVQPAVVQGAVPAPVGDVALPMKLAMTCHGSMPRHRCAPRSRWIGAM
jgi:hypothetical protein